MAASRRMRLKSRGRPRRSAALPEVGRAFRASRQPPFSALWYNHCVDGARIGAFQMKAALILPWHGKQPRRTSHTGRLEEARPQIMAQGLGLVRVPLAGRDLGHARDQAFAPICEAQGRRQGMVALTLRLDEASPSRCGADYLARSPQSPRRGRGATAPRQGNCRGRASRGCAEPPPH